MVKNCLNCDLYLKVKGETSLGKVYFCFPQAKGVPKHKLAINSCDKWRIKNDNDVLNFLKGFVK